MQRQEHILAPSCCAHGAKSICLIAVLESFISRRLDLEAEATRQEADAVALPFPDLDEGEFPDMSDLAIFNP